MGRIEKNGDDIVYRQDDGEITALLNNYEEKTKLGHEGRPIYNKVFYWAVTIGALYLFLIFLFF